MDLDELNKLWAEDCKIDDIDLTGELRRIPILHNKYYNLYVRTGLKVSKLKSELVVLVKEKTEYYNGTMDPKDIIDRGWPINPLKIIRQDLNKYIESDADIIKTSLRIDYMASMEKYLENIITQLTYRNNTIGNMIKWEMFRSGVN